MHGLQHRPVYLLVVLLAVFGAEPRVHAQRLPADVVPEHYSLHFTPDLAAERFTGEAEIRIKVVSQTTRVVLHAAHLEVITAAVGSGGSIQPAEVKTDVPAQTVALHVRDPLSPGPAEIRLTYRGTLNRDLRGFYISEANGRKYAVTQLQATDARRMFPAFDEPRYKATFDIQATVDTNDNAISNGAVESIRPAPGGKHTFDFATTKPMSSYLVALAVGDFECVRQHVGATPLGICATPGNQSLTAFAMEAATASLRYLNEYFEIDYPFGKLDLVAIPDFAAGAMENTGAVFFRESLLLVGPEASLATKKRAATVIAHELAHMWFGNLVTMAWWDDLWLNEGFATWMETKAIAAWKPEWNLELDELQAIHGVMVIDTRRATRPVRVAAETPEEIEALFDALAYEKGAAVIGMTESFAGEQAWQRAINAYLAAHQYGNATADDFWSTATRLADRPIDRVMRAFVDRPGVPLVSIETTCTASATRVTLTQEPFARATGSTSPWPIPVCLETRGDAAADSCHLFETQEGSVSLPGCSRWVVGNAGAEGYYRTSHGPDALSRLLVANAELAADERLMLVADHWALMRARKADLVPFFRVTRALASDAREPAVIVAIGQRLQFVREYLTTAETRATFEEWVRKRFSPMLALAEKRLEDTDTTRARHAALLGIVGGIGRDADVLADAREAMRKYLRGTPAERIAPEILDAYVALAALSGDAPLYQAYRDRAERATTPEERYRFLNALAAFRDESVIGQTLAYAMSPKVRSQDRALLVARILANPVARPLAWRDIQTHWEELQAGVGAFGGTTRIIDALSAFCDADAARDIQTFFEKHPVPGSDRVLAQTIEDVQSCAALVASQRDSLSRALGAAE